MGGYSATGDWPPAPWWVAPDWLEDKAEWNRACEEIADLLKLRLPRYRGWPCPPGGGGGWRQPGLDCDGFPE